MAGTVRKRGRSWQAILNFRDPLNAGKMVQFTATRPTRREAESAMADLIVRRDHEQLARGNQTFGLAAEKWRQAKEQTAAPSSLLRYDIGLNTHLLPRFGDVQLRRLRTVALDDFYADLRRKGMAPNSILWQHNLVHSILRYAQRTLKWISSNPADNANPPRRAATTIHLPSHAELGKLIRAADEDGPVLGAFVRLAIATGARRGELCALQWKHVDLETGQLVIVANVTQGAEGYIVKAPKSGRGRRLALPAAMVDHLVLYRSWRAVRAESVGEEVTPESYVFGYNPTGRDFANPGTVSEKFATAKRVAGVRQLRLHDMRHQAATVLLNNRISPRVVAERLGHSRTSTTLDVYAQFLPPADQEAADILGGLLT
jgi:integrase